VIVSHDGVIEPRDQLQARVVERLRAAHGAPVSFTELRGMGIENPALLGYELAAAGLPIEQVREWGSRALILDPLADSPAGPERSDEQPGRAPAADVPARSVSHRRILRRPSRAGAVASAAMVVVLAALLALTLSAHQGRQPRLSADHAHHGLGRSHASSAEQHASPSSSPGTTPVKRSRPEDLAARKPSVVVSPAAAASLEAAGHQLLYQGRYTQAIGVLREALQASGGSGTRCAEPTSEACLTFAYALYDLGSALRLEGDPHAAIPILSERLQINNQRAAVEEQLDLARAGVV
jgi:tetratricopeptide (TPR) repeat protein